MKPLPALFIASLFGAAQAAATVYHYDGDAVPTAGTYGNWFTTVGSGAFGYFPGTSWSSNGSVLTMTTATNQGLWFGRWSGFNDTTGTMAFAPTLGGNFVEARLALSSLGTGWTWSFFDGDARGGRIDFDHHSLSYQVAATPGGAGVATTLSIDLTVYHTVSAYFYNSQVHYFLDGVHLGGGHALGNAVNSMAIGDHTATSGGGTGSMFIDYLTVTTAVGSESPLPIPEPATTAAVLGLLGGALALARRSRVLG